MRSPWRDREPPAENQCAVRATASRRPRTGETIVDDLVKGRVVFQNKELDDLVLLRSDGAPTYNLAVVVDDADMGITHVIRGDDHLNNAARQTLIFEALGWAKPAFAHLPLIHGPDGAKLSKRHGAQAVSEFADMGYLPEAMRNYLARLGWGHGDDEIFSEDQAVAWFDVKDVVSAPARLDDWASSNFINQPLYPRSAEPTPGWPRSWPPRVHREPRDLHRPPRTGSPAWPRAMALVRDEGAQDRPGTGRPDRVRAEDPAPGAWIEKTIRRTSGPRDAASAAGAPAANQLADEGEWGRGSVAAPETAMRDFKAGGPRASAWASSVRALRGVLSGRAAPAPDAWPASACRPGAARRRLRANRRCSFAVAVSRYKAIDATGAGGVQAAGTFEKRHWGHGPTRIASDRIATLNVRGKAYDLPIIKGTTGPDVLDVRKLYADADVFTFDPGFTSTASCESKITYIDGDAGILLHRGYSIEELAEKSSFLEVCYLLLNGELPTAPEFDRVREDHYPPHHGARRSSTGSSQGFRRDAHADGDHGWRRWAASPPSITTASMSDDPRSSARSRRIRHDRQDADHRGAARSNIRSASPSCTPRNELSYAGELPAHVPLSVSAEDRKSYPIAVTRAMERIFDPAGFDHEQDKLRPRQCAWPARQEANPFACIAAGIACLWGPLPRRAPTKKR